MSRWDDTSEAAKEALANWGESDLAEMLVGCHAALERAAAIAPYEHATYGDRSEGYRNGWDACRNAFREALFSRNTTGEETSADTITPH